MAIVMAATALVVAQEVPNVIVERHGFQGDQAFRITLFDNRMAVTSVRDKGKQIFLRQLVLGDAEFEVYLAALSEVAAEAGAKNRTSVETADSGARVALDVPGFSPRLFFYSPLQVLDLPTARLVAILDDLQLRVTEAHPSEEALRNWIPKVGDRVELFIGGVALVTEARDDGVLVIEQPDSGVILIVPSFERPQIIKRLLSP